MKRGSISESHEEMWSVMYISRVSIETSNQYYSIAYFASHCQLVCLNFLINPVIKFSNCCLQWATMAVETLAHGITIKSTLALTHTFL